MFEILRLFNPLSPRQDQLRNSTSQLGIRMFNQEVHFGHHYAQLTPSGIKHPIDPRWIKLPGDNLHNEPTRRPSSRDSDLRTADTHRPLKIELCRGGP